MPVDFEQLKCSDSKFILNALKSPTTVFNAFSIHQSEQVENGDARTSRNLFSHKVVATNILIGSQLCVYFFLLFEFSLATKLSPSPNTSNFVGRTWLLIRDEIIFEKIYQVILVRECGTEADKVIKWDAKSNEKKTKFAEQTIYQILRIIISFRGESHTANNLSSIYACARRLCKTSPFGTIENEHNEWNECKHHCHVSRTFISKHSFFSLFVCLCCIVACCWSLNMTMKK